MAWSQPLFMRLHCHSVLLSQVSQPLLKRFSSRFDRDTTVLIGMPRISEICLYGNPLTCEYSTKHLPAVGTWLHD